MQRVSSNLTILFKIFIPTVWIVFFSIFTLMLFIASEQQIPFLTSPSFKFPFLAAYILFFLLIYFTLLQLKRVEMGAGYYYVSNYFKTYKLIYEDIERVDIIPVGRILVVTFHLRARSSFGKKIIFLASKNLFTLFLRDNPDVAQVFKELMTDDVQGLLDIKS